ncbi:hypothetical protein D3C73_1386940 [compost metagenome]
MSFTWISARLPAASIFSKVPYGLLLAAASLRKVRDSVIGAMVLTSVLTAEP